MKHSRSTRRSARSPVAGGRGPISKPSTRPVAPLAHARARRRGQCALARPSTVCGARVAARPRPTAKRGGVPPSGLVACSGRRCRCTQPPVRFSCRTSRAAKSGFPRSVGYPFARKRAPRRPSARRCACAVFSRRSRDSATSRRVSPLARGRRARDGRVRGNARRSHCAGRRAKRARAA